jgi:hypothetical protein
MQIITPHPINFQFPNLLKGQISELQEEPFKILDLKGLLIKVKLIFERTGITCQKDGLI